MQCCDVLVVGAGPAGAAAALEAVKGGVHVVVVEKRKRPGYPVRCAEFIPRPLLMELDSSYGCIVQESEALVTFLPGEEPITTKLPGFMINRDVLEKGLLADAASRGAGVLIETCCRRKEHTCVTAAIRGREITLASRIIIGADGPRSTVGSWMGSVNREFMLGLQYEVPLANPMKHTEIYFEKDFFGGYGWLFPKGRSANAGIGVRYNPRLQSCRNIRRLLEAFMERLAREGKIKNTVLSAVSGFIPVGPPLPSVRDNMLLVGDAACQIHAITGSGVPQAVICGRMAGRAAVRAVKKGDAGVLASYEKEWRRLYGDELERAWKRRLLLEFEWDELGAALRKCWVIFREYYE